MSIYIVRTHTSTPRRFSSLGDIYAGRNWVAEPVYGPHVWVVDLKNKPTGEDKNVAWFTYHDISCIHYIGYYPDDVEFYEVMDIYEDLPKNPNIDWESKFSQIELLYQENNKKIEDLYHKLSKRNTTIFNLEEDIERLKQPKHKSLGELLKEILFYKLF